MASRAPRPCRHAGCRHLSRDISGYCVEHRSDASGWNDPGRENSNKRGYGGDWKKLRAFVMERDKGLCQPCLANGRPTPAAAVDHIKPKSDGGTDDVENLQAICNPCHQVKTQKESQRGRGGIE